MYSFKPELSEFTQQATRIIKDIDLNTNPLSDESFTIVLFRIDPTDTSRYVVCHSGLREKEPMFVPKIRDDEATRNAGENSSLKERAFRFREGIPAGPNHCRVIYFGKQYNPFLGVLWVSGRGKANWDEWEKIHADSIGRIETLFERFLSPNTHGRIPIYPELWNIERQTVDSIRAVVRDLGPSPQIEQVAAEITRTLATSIHCLLEPAAQVRVGIYLFTGHSWFLVGSVGLPKYLPREVLATNRKEERVFDYLERDEYDENENAFDWVHRSGRPVYLSHPVSERWTTRIRACGIAVPTGGGVCVAPIKYDLEDTLVMGILLVSIENSNRFSPAHVFLAARISQSIVGYLVRLLPIPGYPFWPDARLGRGDAIIQMSSTNDPRKVDGKTPLMDAETFDWIKEIAACLMPTKSRVTLSELSPGLTGSTVFKLIVSDEGRIAEIPRVLKVGPAEVIADELHRYYRYVHNKPVGWHSRVDIARCFPEMEWVYPKIIGSAELLKSTTKRRKSATAAIVYTFVGEDAQPVPWSIWAKGAERGEIERGIELLLKQLSCWHRRAREEQKPLGKMIVPTAILEKQERRAMRDGDQIVAKMFKWLRMIQEKVESKDVRSSSCVVHGDLHCDNVFAMTEDNSKLGGVAIIDWGKVQSGCHPVTDISILLADLVYRVCYERNDISIDWALELLAHYAPKDATRRAAGLDESELVFTVHLMRMVAWGPREEVRKWFSQEAQEDAMRYIEKKMREVEGKY